MIKLLKNKRGDISAHALAVLAGIVLLGLAFLFIGLAFIRIYVVKTAAQNALDTYTAKIGKQVVNSVKSGHDFTKSVQQDIFERDLQAEINTTASYNISNEAGVIVLTVEDIDVSFMYDYNKLLKTTLTYTLAYTMRFSRKSEITIPIRITQNSLYELKY